MNSKAKSNSVVTSKVSEDGRTIDITVLGAGVLTLLLDGIHADNKARAMCMGLVSRVVDKAALPCDPTTGKPATPEMKFEAMRPIVEHLNSGSADWSPERAKGAGRPKSDGFDPILIAAVCEATGWDEAKLREHIKSKAGGKDVAYLAALGGSRKVSPIVERMRAELASGLGLDGDELLEGMGEGE